MTSLHKQFVKQQVFCNSFYQSVMQLIIKTKGWNLLFPY